MHGIFVTDTYKMVLASTHDGVSVVYRTDDAATGTVDADGKVVLEDQRGVYDGSDSVIWENGTHWKRVDVSEAQFRILTHKPYIPMTFILYSFAKHLISSIYDRVHPYIVSRGSVAEHVAEHVE